MPQPPRSRCASSTRCAQPARAAWTRPASASSARTRPSPTSAQHRRQALTGLVAATVLGTGDSGLRRAVDESRLLLERMGAGLWLAHLDAILADSGIVGSEDEVEAMAGGEGSGASRDTPAPAAGPA